MADEDSIIKLAVWLYEFIIIPKRTDIGIITPSTVGITNVFGIFM